MHGLFQQKNVSVYNLVVIDFLVPVKYPFVFAKLKDVVDTVFNNIQQAVTAFLKDREEIHNELLGEHSLGDLTQLTIGNSDRHCGGKRVVIFTFGCGTKLIWKPRNSEMDTLFLELVDMLNLPEPYNIVHRKVLPKDDYGWFEFIPTKECQSLQQIQRFYNRAGKALF